MLDDDQQFYSLNMSFFSPLHAQFILCLTTCMTYPHSFLRWYYVAWLQCFCFRNKTSQYQFYRMTIKVPNTCNILATGTHSDTYSLEASIEKHLKRLSHSTFYIPPCHLNTSNSFWLLSTINCPFVYVHVLFKAQN